MIVFNGSFGCVLYLCMRSILSVALCRYIKILPHTLFRILQTSRLYMYTFARDATIFNIYTLFGYCISIIQNIVLNRNTARPYCQRCRACQTKLLSFFYCTSCIVGRDVMRMQISHPISIMININECKSCFQLSAYLFFNSVRELNSNSIFYCLFVQFFIGKRIKRQYICYFFSLLSNT